MTELLGGRVALVTGASRGIGRAIALRLARAGASIVVNHPGEPEAAAEVVAAINADGGRALAIEADIAIRTEVNAMVDRAAAELGPVRMLVNNAGICPFMDFFDISEDVWDRVNAVNLKGAFLCSQAVARRLVDEGSSGRIVSISSISARVGGARQVHYTPTKAGVSSLMRSLAIVLGPYGITCNAVCPGAILTDLNRADLTPQKSADFETRIPVGRIGEPADVAGVVAFLCSDEAGYVNGAEVLVDGGLFVNLQ
jgi:L-rhamnose 1-dehydrogenase